MSSSISPRRRFAPLKEEKNISGLPELQGIIFDVDGTLCKPQNHMFAEMRTALAISKGVDILEHVYSLPTPAQQEAAMESIRAIERRMMAEQVAQPGLPELMAHLDARGVRKAICTRNFEQPVLHLLTKFLTHTEFDPIVTRDFRPPKPDPAGLLFIARKWGLASGRRRRRRDGAQGAVRGRRGSREGEKSTRPATAQAREDKAEEGEEEEGEEEEGEEEEEESGGVSDGDASNLIMVGDSIDDMTAGRRAGAATVLLVNDANRHLAGHEHTDLVIDRLDDLVAILDEGFEGRGIA